MATSMGRMGTWAALAGIVILGSALAAGDPVEARQAALVITGLTIVHDVVQVEILNATAAPVSATVHVKSVLSGGETADAFAGIGVEGGQQIVIPLAMGDAVSEVVAVGVVLDDGAPF